MCAHITQEEEEETMVFCWVDMNEESILHITQIYVT